MFSKAGLVELGVVFVGAFAASFLLFVEGLGAAPDYQAAKAAVVSALFSAFVAGFKAALSAFVKSQEPFANKGIIQP